MFDDYQKEKIQLAAIDAEAEAAGFINSFPRITLYLILGLIVGALPAYYVARSATAAIFRDNFNRNAIVFRQSSTSELPVKVLETKALPLLGSNYSAYAVIKNPNQNLSAQTVPYTFTFFDAAGAQISTFSDSTSLLPGEQKYIIASNIRLSTMPSKIEVSIRPLTWQRRITLPNIVLKTSIPTSSDNIDPVGFNVDGYFINQGVYQLKTVRISAIAFDSGGQVIAVTQTTANTIKPNETRSYHLFWPLPLSGTVKNIKIQAETNLLDSGNMVDPRKVSP